MNSQENKIKKQIIFLVNSQTIYQVIYITMLDKKLNLEKFPIQCN